MLSCVAPRAPSAHPPTSRQRPKKKARRRPPVRDVNRELDRLEHSLQNQLDKLRYDLESDADLSDEELEDIEQALTLIDGERDTTVPPPTEAIAKEALIAEYGLRYDRKQSLYSPRDAVQRKRSRPGRPEEDGADMRFSLRKKRYVTAEGRIRTIEQTVYHNPMGEQEVIAEQEVQDGLDADGEGEES